MDYEDSPESTPAIGKRKLKSWIDRFIAYADKEAESPLIYRKWTAITTIAACLEQKVWINSPTTLYPNMYVFLVGHPGVGKSRTIGLARRILASLPDFPFAPTQVTMASLVDSLKENERRIEINKKPIFYNSMTVMPDDLQVLMSSYDHSLISGLTTFYDCDHPFREQKRTGNLRVEIKRPQLSILGGTTPSHLFGVIPEDAWSQGFTSRLLLIHSNEKAPKTVQFNDVAIRQPKDLIWDLKIINKLQGEFTVEPKAETAFRDWREAGEPPLPSHKRLEHYLVRRYAHLLKLSMVSAVDRNGDLLIITEDFNRALGWLIEAEDQMPAIFQTGQKTVETGKMEEVYFYMKSTDPQGKGLYTWQIQRFLNKIIATQHQQTFWNQMVAAKLVKKLGLDAKTKDKLWVWLEL